MNEEKHTPPLVDPTSAVTQFVLRERGSLKDLLEEKIVGLQALIDEKISGLKELILQHDELTDLAITKSQDTLNERLQKVNEFRDQQKDILATVATQKEVDLIEQHLTEKIDAFRKDFEGKISAVSDAKGTQFETNAEKIREIRIWMAMQDARQEIVSRNIGKTNAFLISVALAVVIALILNFLKL